MKTDVKTSYTVHIDVADKKIKIFCSEQERSFTEEKEHEVPPKTYEMETNFPIMLLTFMMSIFTSIINKHFPEENKK